MPEPSARPGVLALLVALAALSVLSGPAVVRAAQTGATPVHRIGEVLPVEDVRAGMRGVGYTVIAGVDPTEFRVEILGVLHDLLPKVDVIVARLEGLGLERSNVVAGMSGSPVYIDGKLVGAVAYRMISFAHEPIAGIVPIRAMMDVSALGDGPPRIIAAAPDRIRRVLAAAAALVTGEEQGTELEPMHALPESGLTAIATPVSLGGFHPGLVRSVTPLFESLGWAPMLGVAGGAGEAVPANLVPGGAVAVQLMRGDINVTASGTVTARDGDRVYAFGHPFLQGGDVDFPMVAASVMTVLSSAADSRKLSVAGSEVLGAIRQDRLPAIMGLVGASPELIPVRLQLDRPGRSETLRFELVSDPLLTPLYLFLGMVNGVQSIDQVYGEGSVEIEARIHLQDSVEPVRFGNLFSSQNQAIVSLSSNLASIFAFLYGNEFEPARIREVDMTVSLRGDRRSATISRVWYDRSDVRPGDTVRIGVALEPFRDEEIVETLTFRVPESTPVGPLTVVVGDAQSILKEEQGLIQGSFEPRDLAHLVRLLNGIRRSDRIYLQASLPAEGALVNGEVLPALRPSILRMLTSERTAGDVIRLQRTVIAEQAEPVDFVVSGSHRIELNVRR